MVGGAVPRYRLDDEKLRIDLDRLASLGVKIHYGKAIGRRTWPSTISASRFDYVFLGVGAQKGKKLGIPGEDAEGVVDALEFLDGLRDGVKRDFGKRVLVVGGGNSAMDGARSAKRLVGDGEVSLVYRRTRAEMPADPAEVRDCEVEGIGLKDLLAPARVVVENGRAVGLACTRMKLGEPDALRPPASRPARRERGRPPRRHDRHGDRPGAGPRVPRRHRPRREEGRNPRRPPRDGGDLASRLLRRRRRRPRPRLDHQGGRGRPRRGQRDRPAPRRPAAFRRAAPRRRGHPSPR